MTDESEQMVTDCEARESKLTDWERGFVDSLRQAMERGKRITPRQQETLDEIWERIT